MVESNSVLETFKEAMQEIVYSVEGAYFLSKKALLDPSFVTSVDLRLK
jgi:hypothetical protein